MCTDSAGVMLGKKKGLKAYRHKARVLQVAPHINFKHCIIHREALASKTLDPELKHVLETAIKIVNYIKARPISGCLPLSVTNCSTQKSGGFREGMCSAVWCLSCGTKFAYF